MADIELRGEDLWDDTLRGKRVKGWNETKLLEGDMAAHFSFCIMKVLSETIV